MKKIIQLFLALTLTIAVVLSGTVAMASETYYKTVCKRNEMTNDEIQLCTVTTNKKNGGYVNVRSATSDAASHGNVYAVGIDAAGTMPYLRPEMQTKLSDILHVDFDLYVSSGGGIRWEHRNATNATAFSVNNETLTIGDKSYISFYNETWFEIKLTFNYTDHNMDIVVNDDNGIFLWSASDVAMAANNSLASLAHFRVHYSGVIPGFYEIDNLHEYFESPEPAINSCASADSDAYSDGIKYDTSSLNFTHSGNIVASSISSDSVELLCGSDSVVLSDVSYNTETKNINVVPKYNLDPNTTYKLVLNSETEVFDDVKLRNNVNYTFVTAKADVQLEDYNFVKSDGGLLFEGIVSNNTDAEKTAYVLMNIWSGNKILKIVAQSFDIVPSNDKTVSVFAPSLPSGAVAEVIVISDLTTFLRCGKAKYTYIN